MAAVFALCAEAQVRPLPADVGPLAEGAAFVLQTCGETASSTGWTTTTNANEATLAGGFDCPPNTRPPGFPNSFQQSGIWVSDRLRNAGGGIESAAGDRIEVTFTPPAGTTIARMRYYRSIKKENEDNYQAYISLDTRGNVIDTCEINGESICYVGGDDWYPNDTSTVARGAYRELTGLSASSIILGMYCRPNEDSICGNGYSLTNIDVQIFSAFLTIDDPVVPVVGTPVGAGWTEGDWAQGTLPLAVSSSDNTGISATRVYADGSLVASLQRSCVYDRPRPCSDEPTGAVGLPTGGLADGRHVISVGAVDAGGLETRVGRPTELKVDNNAPAAPVGLGSPEAVSASNSFSASWALPSDAGSPIVAARYELCQGGVCGPVRTASSLTSVDGLVLPAAGVGTLRVWLVDELGHEARAGAATVKLTYAPAVPEAPVGPAPGGAAPPGVVPPGGGGQSPPQAPGPVVPVVRKRSAALKITSVRYASGRVLVRGSVSSRASGLVTVRFKARVGGRARTVTARAKIRAKAFRTTIRLARAVARARAGTVAVTYGGDADTQAASRQATIRWRG